MPFVPDDQPSQGGFVPDEPILPSVQAARNVAASQTPETGVATGKGPLTDLANSFLFNLGRTVYNIPHGIANLVLGASENFDPSMGLNKSLTTAPEDIQQAANDRALQEKIRQTLTEPINEPIMKLGGLTAADLTNPESPTMRYPGAGFLGEQTPNAAMALEGLLKLPSVANAAGSAVESANNLGASILQSRQSLIDAAKNKLTNNRLTNLLNVENSKAVLEAKAAVPEIKAAAENKLQDFIATYKDKRTAAGATERIAANDLAATQADEAAKIKAAEDLAASQQQAAQDATQQLEARNAQVQPQAQAAQANRDIAQGVVEQQKYPRDVAAEQVGTDVHSDISTLQEADLQDATDKFTALEESAAKATVDPKTGKTIPPIVESQDTFDAAKKIRGEFSTGFNRADNGDVSAFAKEAAQTTPVKSIKKDVPNEIKSAYEKSDAAGKQLMEEINPDFFETKNVKPSYTLGEMLTRYKNVNAAWSKAKELGLSDDMRKLDGLRIGLESDIKRYSKKLGTDSHDLFLDANQTFKDAMKRFENVQGLISEDFARNPTKVVDKLLSESSPTFIRDVMEKVSPETAAKIKGVLADDLFSAVRGEDFNLDHFVDRFGKAKNSVHEKWSEAFGSDKYKELENLYNAAKEHKRIQPMVEEIQNLDEIRTKALDKAQTARTSAESLKQKRIAQEALDSINRVDKKLSESKDVSISARANRIQLDKLKKAIDESGSGVDAARNAEIEKRKAAALKALLGGTIFSSAVSLWKAFR